MVKPKNMPKAEIPEVELPKMEELDAETIVENTIKESGANTIEIPKVEMPKVEIIPGKKVKVEGKDGIFTVIQKLSDGKVSLAGDGIMLYVKPNRIKNIK